MPKWIPWSIIGMIVAAAVAWGAQTAIVHSNSLQIGQNTRAIEELSNGAAAVGADIRWIREALTEIKTDMRRHDAEY